ncbi:MAG: penicillin-binding protein 2 [Candidatus Omnitrophica bacterium]|nr:penicillin-binding protein 2 [Candidatus Omnitrophota bacterium]
MDATYIRRIYLASFFVIVFVLFYYQILRGDYYNKRALNNYVRIIPITSIRGNIFDRKGILLAQDKPSFNIAVIPYQIRWTKEILFEEIAKFLGYDKSLLYKNYKRNFKNFFSPVDIIINLDKKVAIELKEKFQDKILINIQPIRYYPYPYEVAHIIGYVKEAENVFDDTKKYGFSPKERVGVLGVEQYYNKYLAGEDGGYLIEVNANSEIVGFLGERKPKKGSDIILTIDYQIQRIAYEALSQKRGVIILMDLNSGEIITLASSPSFDLNSFITGENVSRFLNDKNKPLLNRAIQATYPPGSTFKPIIALAALSENIIFPKTTFICKKIFSIGDYNFHCLGYHEDEDLYYAMLHSCNVYFYNVGLKLGVEKIIKYAKKFMFDSTTKIDLPYEKEGYLPHHIRYSKNWFIGDTLNLAIGQGMLEVSPLRLLVSMSAIANGGYLVKPHILKAIDGNQQNLSSNIYLGVSDSLLGILKKTLIGVVKNNEGTGYLLNKLNLKIAGKTGTAQTRTKAHGWFVGFFPYDKPKYGICVLLEEAGSSFEAVKLSYFFLKELINKNILDIKD